MPKIQIYESQVEAQAPQAPQVQLEQFTGGWRNATEAFKTLDETTKKFENLRNENEVLKTSTDFKIALQEIENEADKDGDPKNAPKYRQKVDEAIATHLQGISSEQLRNKASESFRLSGYTTYSNIQNKFNKQVVEQAQDNLFQNIEVNRKSYIGTVDPVKKREAIDTALASIDSGIQSGYITAESARKLRDEVNKDWINGEATFDAQSNPDMFITEATKPDGRYASMDTDTKVKLIDYAEKRKETMKKQQDDLIEEQNNKAKADQLAIGDDLTPEDVNIAITNGVYKDPAEAEKFMEFAINGIQIDAKTDPGVYTQLMNEFYTLGKRGKKDKELTDASKSAADINAFRIKARQANLDKKLSDVDYKDLIDGSQKAFDKSVRAEVEKNNGTWKNFVNGLNLWADTIEGDVESKKSEYMAEFNRRTNVAGERADVVSSDIMGKIASEKYPMIAGKKIGDVIENQFKVKRIFKGFNQNGQPVLERIK
jgi:hypothetical protein